MNGTRWKFGRGQTFNQEGHEIAGAKGAGLIDAYLHCQRCAQLIEGEREARRRGKHKARHYR